MPTTLKKQTNNYVIVRFKCWQKKIILKGKHIKRIVKSTTPNKIKTLDQSCSIKIQSKAYIGATCIILWLLTITLK